MPRVLYTSGIFCLQRATAQPALVAIRALRPHSTDACCAWLNKYVKDVVVTQAHAPAKVILFGEHAVVYGQPAIAVPVTDVRATVIVEPAPLGAGIAIDARDIERTVRLDEAPSDEPLALTVRNTLAHLGLDERKLDLNLTIISTIPVASGLGSGAAVAVALIRALSARLGRPLDAAQVSALAYRTETLFHGTPSGIDNTVIAYERPVYFKRNCPIETFGVHTSFWIAIADTGRPGLTKASVADVRAAWQCDPAHYNALFDAIGCAVDRARQAIEKGDVAALGPLMLENQALLRRIDVSSPELETLIAAALGAGAAGAKLSGGGRGGNMIALVTPQNAGQIRRALLDAGAKNVIVTGVGT
ncbi:MAG: mevalonate kinase [Anaerolineae bacterium]|nr:mevalonate kinase [Anaerolineae bacterium]